MEFYAHIIKTDEQIALGGDTLAEACIHQRQIMSGSLDLDDNGIDDDGDGFTFCGKHLVRIGVREAAQ